MSTDESAGENGSTVEQSGEDAGGSPAAALESAPAAPEPRLSSDWARYGLGQAARSTYQAPTSSTAALNRRPEPRDDSFLEYRRENAPRTRRAPNRRSSRSIANAVGAGAVGVAAVALLVAGMVTSGPTPTPTPVPTPSAIAVVATPTPSASPSEALAARPAQIQVVINLPVSVYVPDRAQSPDDGTIMYLAGGSGAVAVDPLSGASGTVFGGEAFAHGARRWLVAAGSLWVSWWPPTFLTCGPTCWAQAATYRLNVGTGKIQQAFPKTLLVGLSGDGLWLASGNKVQRLDLKTGAPVATTPWPGIDEPRVGCGDLWAINIPTVKAPKTSTPALGLVDVVTGQKKSSVTLVAGESYGPVSVSSRCWMMTGWDGFSPDKATFAQIGGDGSVVDIVSTASTVLALDGEFWSYSTGELIQRLEPGSATAYGPAFKMSVAPTTDDAGRLFASMGSLWMIDGQRLVGFDVLLGPENSAG